MVVHAHELGSITADPWGSGTVPNSWYGAVLGSRSTKRALPTRLAATESELYESMKVDTHDPRTAPYHELGTVPEPKGSAVMDLGS